MRSGARASTSAGRAVVGGTRGRKCSVGRADVDVGSPSSLNSPYDEKKKVEKGYNEGDDAQAHELAVSVDDDDCGGRPKDVDGVGG